MSKDSDGCERGTPSSSNERKQDSVPRKNLKRRSLPFACSCAKQRDDHEMGVLYRAWKGQLFIQNQRVCDVALRTPFLGSIPAQLPAKLEIKYVLRVSELRKTLPEAAFVQNNYADNEVHYQGIQFSLYEVETSNPKEQKADQLIRSLKENNIALIKDLNDRGVFILLASSALRKEKDSNPDESSGLQALFLISAPKPMCLTAKDLKNEQRGSERSLQITSALPSLRYALFETSKHHKDERLTCSTLVKQHFQEFAKLDRSALPASANLDQCPFSSNLFVKKSDLDALSEKCPEHCLPHLQFYLSNPADYILEMPMASTCFGSDSSSPGSGAGLSSVSLPPDGPVETDRPRRTVESRLHQEDTTRRTSQVADRTLQWCKRKSSRLLSASARKKWAPLKVLSIMESNKKRKKKKAHRVAPPNQEAPTNSEEPTLKLQNLQYPLRRKRGAEVLSAEFVQRTRCESAAEATSSSKGLGTDQKKARFLRHAGGSDVAKVLGEENMITRQSKRRAALRGKDEMALECPQEAGHKTEVLGERAVTQTASPSPRKDECDSHALNMLADLALSSCNSPLLPNACSRASLPHSLSRGRYRLQKGKFSHKASDHEYHRVNSKAKDNSPPSTSHQQPLSASASLDPSTELTSSLRERHGASTSKRGQTKPALDKSSAVPQMVTGDLSDLDASSLISSEHSYASPLMESSKKQLPLKGTPATPSSKNGVKNMKPGPLVGKVLPFRHQQITCHPQKQFKNYIPFNRSCIMAARLKEDFCKTRKVNFCNGTVTVTCKWETEYLFSLDSKYTNNFIEKTVIRAVHGPWDISMSDDVEEMKLILHMWVALFYSKPFRAPTVRKVVEHNNPAKFVSLNSIVDPLEPVEDCEGSYSLEKCPADSLSEANQVSSEADERASSPTEKPLSCNELSSTNCVEDEGSLVDPEMLDVRALKVGEVPSSSSADALESFSQESGEAREETLYPVTSIDGLNGTSKDECSGGCLRPQSYGSDLEHASVTLADVSKGNMAPGDAEEPPERTADKQPVETRTGAAISTESWEVNSTCLVEKDGAGESLQASQATWLEASVEHQEEDRPRGEVGDTRNRPVDEKEEDVDGESMELESINLTLSESNESDLEPRDVDLDQNNEGLPEETCVVDERETATTYNIMSSGDGILALSPAPSTNSAHQVASKEVTVLPTSQDDHVVAAPSLAEGFCVSQEDKDNDLACSVQRQPSPVHQTTFDKETGLPKVDDPIVSVSRCITPNQTDWVEGSGSSQEDQGIFVADSVALEAAELVQVPSDLATNEESIGNKDVSLVSVENSTIPNPVDVFVEGSCFSEEDTRTNPVESVSLKASLVHQTTCGEIKESPGNQEGSAEPIDYTVSPKETVLMEGVLCPLTSSPLQTCDLCPLQNSLLTPSNSSGSQDDSALLAQTIAPAEQTDLADISQKDSLKTGPIHQKTPDEVAALPGEQDDPGTSATVFTPPKQMESFSGSCSPQGEQGIQLAGMHLLQADQPPQVQSSGMTQEEQKTTELLDDCPSETENRNSEPGDMNLDVNSGDGEGCVKELAEAFGSSSVPEEIAHGAKLTQVTVSVPEAVKSCLCDLIDTVSALSMKSEGTLAQERSEINWISSLTLECVTPFESEDECGASDLPVRADSRLLPLECSAQQSVSVGREPSPLTALQEQGQPRSQPCESTNSDSLDVAERRSCQEDEAVAAAVPGLSHLLYIDRTTTGTGNLEYPFPLGETDVLSKDSGATAPSPCDCVDLELTSLQVSEGESQRREGDVERLPSLASEDQIDCLSEESGCLLSEDSRGSLELGNPEVELEERWADERTQGPTRAAGPNIKRIEEYISGEDGQEPYGDTHLRSRFQNICSTGSPESTGDPETTYVCVLSPKEEVGERGDRMYLGRKKRIAEVETEVKQYNRPFEFQKDAWNPPSSPNADRSQGPLKGYINFSVTKKHKEKTRTFHSSKRQEPFAKEARLINASSVAWRSFDDPVQNTLDMECLRFHYKLKQIVENKKPQLPTSSATLSKEFVPQMKAETLPQRKIPETPALNPSTRSKDGPLLVTIVNTSLRQNSSCWRPRAARHSDDPFEASLLSFSKAARFRSPQGQGQPAPIHLNKLTYNNKLKECRGDISVIMDEFAELSRVMKLDDRQTSNKRKEPNSTSEDLPAPTKRGMPLPRRAASYDHLVTELCDTLHVRLQNVAKEACETPYAFYVVETDNDPFFGRMKNLLKKGGHAESEPLHFCKTSHPETDRLMVIIRNEDLLLQVHKIPSLLRLKRCANVTFAGVDSPEDILDHTHQELFHSGGFVVSDDKVLETVTIGELKEIVKALEKLNCHRRWKWLIHYREMKKLREDARVDSAARAKDSILRSCQGVDVMEVLHYHSCDSRSSPRSEYLNCLLHLQVQHISARFAVFLTEKPSSIREALESKGILVLDVKTFLATAQGLATPSESSYW